MWNKLEERKRFCIKILQNLFSKHFIGGIPLWTTLLLLQKTLNITLVCCFFKCLISYSTINAREFLNRTVLHKYFFKASTILQLKIFYILYGPFEFFEVFYTETSWFPFDSEIHLWWISLFWNNLYNICNTLKQSIKSAAEWKIQLHIQYHLHYKWFFFFFSFKKWKEYSLEIYGSVFLYILKVLLILKIGGIYSKNVGTYFTEFLKNCVLNQPSFVCPCCHFFKVCCCSESVDCQRYII